MEGTNPNPSVSGSSLGANDNLSLRTEQQSKIEINASSFPEKQDLNFNSAESSLEQALNATSSDWSNQENFLALLENYAKQYSQSLVTLLHNLQNSLHETTALSLQYMKVYKTAVDNVNEAVNQSIVVMHQFILKAQQLNDDLKKVQTLAQQIKEVKKTLPSFEKLVDSLKKVKNPK